jgi:hypothetical protein
MRPEKVGDRLSLFRRGRVKSSSSAELREEVPEPSSFASTGQPLASRETRTKYLPDSAKIRFALVGENRCRGTYGKKDEDWLGAAEGDHSAPKALRGNGGASPSGDTQAEEGFGSRGRGRTTCLRGER